MGTNDTTFLTCNCSTVFFVLAEDADQIDSDSIQWDASNDTNSAVLRWKTPKETNGKILTYLIQYRRVDIENVSRLAKLVEYIATKYDN